MPRLEIDQPGTAELIESSSFTFFVVIDERKGEKLWQIYVLLGLLSA